MFVLISCKVEKLLVGKYHLICLVIFIPIVFSLVIIVLFLVSVKIISNFRIMWLTSSKLSVCCIFILLKQWMIVSTVGWAS